MDKLPYGEENVAKVMELIATHHLDAEIVRHPHKEVTSLEIHLELYGGTPDQVLKCLCMVSKNRPIVVMASGEVRIDTKKLEKLSGMKDIRMAKREELEGLFGRIPGSVDALTVSESVALYADKKLFEKEWVVGSAGSPYAGLRIKPKEILKVKQPIVLDLAKEESNGQKS